MEQLLFIQSQVNQRKEVLSNLFKRFTITRTKRREEQNRNAFLLQKIHTEHHKNAELHKSIAYAKRIQDAMMLKDKHLRRLFPESFLLYKPKDIVSGDFYWFTRMNNKIIVAVADCTGHGIPGAFMSVLGISLLNQLIIEEQQHNPSLILQRLNHKLKKAFSNSFDYLEGDNHHDGMDIALCCIDTEAKTIEFSGAFRPIYLLQNQQLLELKGSRYPIGGLFLENNRQYNSKLLTYEPGDKLYLCSDGFADQFGGHNDKKLMTKKLKSMLHSTAHNPMHLQEKELERLFTEWKKDQDQTDDILLLGLQLH